MYQQINGQPDQADKNVFFSPYSLSTAMAMLYAAAEGETKAQIQKTFHYPAPAILNPNSAVINIVNHSMQSDNFKGLELKTKETPYGIILNYDGSESEKSHKKTVVYNATYLFALIQNVEWITFNFDHQEYKITKDALIEWYGEDFSKLQSKKELKTLIQNNWDDEYRVNQLF